MEIPDYQPFYIETMDGLRSEIARLGLEIPSVSYTHLTLPTKRIV